MRGKGYFYFCLLGTAVALVGALHSAIGQTGYPRREITLIVPFAAGGPTDIVARIVAEGMSRSLQQAVNVENVVGAGGTTAALRAKRATPDGYTIMVGHMGTHAAAVAFNPTLPYDPQADFSPIGLIAMMPVLAVARSGLPARTLAEFSQYAKAKGAEIKMAHAGIGSVSYATCLLLNAALHIKPTLVAFQGTGPAMSGLVSGEVDYMCDQIVTVVPQVRAGQIRALAIATANRAATLPNVPTAVEAGVPAFDASAWNALFAPRGTPPDVVGTLSKGLADALDDPAIRERLLDLGSDIPEGNARKPKALAALVKSEIARWMTLTHATPGN